MKEVINELFRFRMLMAGVYTGLAVSSTYGFSILSEYLKTKYGFDQADITTISTVGNCVGYLSFFAGMLFDFAGPKVVLPIAGFLGFLGFLLFGLALDDAIPTKSSKEVNMIQFCIFNAILYLGCPALDVATVMPLMMNFPLERGYMVIIQKTFSGLGTSILMAYFNGWFADVNDSTNGNYSGYCYFVGAQILFCALVGAYFTDLPPYVQCQFRRKRLTAEEKERRDGTLKLFMTQHASMPRLYYGCALVGTNLVFLFVSSVVTGFVKTSKGGYVAISIIAAVLVAAFAVMALPFQFLGAYAVAEKSSEFGVIGFVSDEQEEQDAASERLPNAQPVDSAGTGDDSAELREDGALREHQEHSGKNDGEDAAIGDVSAEGDEAPEAPVAAIVDPQYRGTFWSHLLTPDLWLLWVSFFGMWGTGTVMQMNAAQIYRSKNYGVYQRSRLSLYVAIIGVGSAIGRIASGTVDMILTRRKAGGKRTVLTTTFLPVASLLLCLAYLLFAVIPANGLILPFLIGAIGTGVGWGLGVLSIRIMYADDIGKHYNFMFSSGFVCTIALNRFMFGDMYDALSVNGACNRPICVTRQMWILMAVNVVATATAFFAHLRFKWFVDRERQSRSTNGEVAEVRKDDDDGHKSEEPYQPSHSSNYSGKQVEE